LEAFHVDARIPRLYIAHARMTHNETSPRVFRIRSLCVWMFVGLWVCFFSSVLNGRKTGRQTESHNGSGERTKTGFDVYKSMNSEVFYGKRIGLITNQTGVDSEGFHASELFAQMRDVKLVALFSPEHGINGNADDIVASAAAGTVPVYSLYGETRHPTDAMLKGIDVLIFDIQDVGVRFYTYVTTMAYCMEAAAKHHISFIVFDRPNPLGGEIIEGPMLDADKLSFVGYFPMPVRYAMTMGELAKMFNAENKIGADLGVFQLRDWRRSEMYWMTGLSWIAPSPNLPGIANLIPYPGIEILQAGGLSVGRGTESAFLEFGAPWIKPEELLAELKRRSIAGVIFEAKSFTPKTGPYAGEKCEGVGLTVKERDGFRSMLMGLEIAEALHKLYPQQFQIEKMITLLGSQSTMERLERGDDPKAIVAGWDGDLAKFRAMRAKYLIYR
jgi:uncharacterized protein YbbC (DUF1343 family)